MARREQAGAPQALPPAVPALSILPRELWAQVFKRVRDFHDVRNVACVSKDFNNIVKNEPEAFGAKVMLRLLDMRGGSRLDYLTLGPRYSYAKTVEIDTSIPVASNQTLTKVVQWLTPRARKGNLNDVVIRYDCSILNLLLSPPST